MSEAPEARPAFNLTFPNPVIDKSEYVDLTDPTVVDSIVEEKESTEQDGVIYSVEFQDGHIEEVSLEALLQLPNGRDALKRAQAESPESDDNAPNTKQQRVGSKRLLEIDDSSSEDIISLPTRTGISRRNAHARGTRSRVEVTTQQRPASNSSSIISVPSSSGSESEEHYPRRSARRPKPRILDTAPQRSTRSRNLRNRRRVNSDDEESEDDNDGSDSSDGVPILQSDLIGKRRTRKRKRSGRTNAQDVVDLGGVIFERSRKRNTAPTRQSQRTTKHRGQMQEVGEDEISGSEPDEPRNKQPKVTGAREAFQPIPPGNAFAVRHCQQCETCGNMGGGPHGQLIYCQGCSIAYHRSCLGTRSTRDHLVTKVGHQEFVLQCRRCVSHMRRKDPTAPNQGMCQVCRKTGSACKPFREKKTVLQEDRERNENFGEDPIYPVNRVLINNPEVPLFRCMGCWRTWHYHHLLSRTDTAMAIEEQQAISEERFREYAVDWRCRECLGRTVKVAGLVAWRPVDSGSYLPGQTTSDVSEDRKEYLVKWQNQSYLKAIWMPGAWVWGVTVPAMRAAFAKKDLDNSLQSMTTEDAIPEDFVRIDIVLDIRFTSKVAVSTEEVDRARIREVSQAFVKYKGLGYEDAVWEDPPTPDEGDRWIDFVTAYDDWVKGRHIRFPKLGPLKLRIEKARNTEFSELEKKQQPESVVGGDLMKYQIEGLNWLYYHWHQEQNAILADEMGLGKTAQIIAALATLVQDHNCFPFLVVVPNSTCLNWRREVRRWSPSLRAVTFFGSEVARDLAYRHELFPEGSKELRCHMVITSYETATRQECQSFFRNIQWQGLVVDEGQRLKNDAGLLYGKLTALKIPFRMLMTGTPLQNNARELFNLLQFLDPSFDAAALEMEYENLTKENIPKLHAMTLPLFLRRTKAQVLTFLPPMAQIIVPITMSVVQKKLYMSILAKNPELIRAIFGSNKKLKSTERANLGNILVQLRKCLAHPFVYNREIEERTDVQAVSHRNLVEASSKLQLLEILLPKLRDRGHRVLIFAQYLQWLDILEDFLDGLQLPYHRLDGNTRALEKQKRIDEFNTDSSEVFAFLLSTRAGGVGINLATADTVIILDPDFNPHQDIQALSRAHRIGQKKKVLCFQIMTQASVEEKIIQIGRKKMALDHVLIDRMDAEEDEHANLETILRHGAAELVSEDATEIKHDDASVDKLLDRSWIEESQAGQEQSAESQFSFARVWENDAGSMMDSLSSSDDDEERAPDPSVWEKILKERERAAAEEASKRDQTLGRGKRARQTINYISNDEVVEGTPAKGLPTRKIDDSDTDFHEGNKSESEDSEGENAAANGQMAVVELNELADTQKPRMSAPSTREPVGTFRRANVIWQIDQTPSTAERCVACGTMHELGHCPLKLAGPEYCNLCGLAHYGISRSCPHIRSETQVREMLHALNNSPESGTLIKLAKKYLTGVKGTIVQEKKKKAEKLATQGIGAAKNLSAASIANIVHADDNTDRSPRVQWIHYTQSQAVAPVAQMVTREPSRSQPGTGLNPLDDILHKA